MIRWQMDIALFEIELAYARLVHWRQVIALVWHMYLSQKNLLNRNGEYALVRKSLSHDAMAMGHKDECICK